MSCKSLRKIAMKMIKVSRIMILIVILTLVGCSNKSQDTRDNITETEALNIVFNEIVADATVVKYEKEER